MDPNKIVTLLDGRKVAYKDVPNNSIYINDQGQKFRKIIKVVTKTVAAPKPAAPAPPKPEQQSGIGGFFSGLAKSVSDAAASVADTVTSVADSVTAEIGDLSDSVTKLAEIKIREMLKNIDFQAAIDSLNDFEAKTGKDTSPLKNFIIKLKDYSKNNL